MAPWKLPLVVVAIAVPVIAAFYVGGPGVGVAIGALAAVTIVAIAVRQRPAGAIEPVVAADGRRLLLVVSEPVEDATTIHELVEAVGEGEGAARVMVLSPAQIGFLDRWASDLEGARQEAQRRLVITVASLAKAGVDAEARVGDEDLVQAVEDQMGGFAPSAVILVTGEPAVDAAGEAAAAELERRLRTEFRRLVVSGPAAR